MLKENAYSAGVILSQQQSQWLWPYGVRWPDGKQVLLLYLPK